MALRARGLTGKFILRQNNMRIEAGEIPVISARSSRIPPARADRANQPATNQGVTVAEFWQRIELLHDHNPSSPYGPSTDSIVLPQ